MESQVLHTPCRIRISLSFGINTFSGNLLSNKSFKMAANLFLVTSGQYKLYQTSQRNEKSSWLSGLKSCADMTFSIAMLRARTESQRSFRWMLKSWNWLLIAVCNVFLRSPHPNRSIYRQITSVNDVITFKNNGVGLINTLLILVRASTNSQSDNTFRTRVLPKG